MPRGVHPGAAVTPSDRDAVFAPCRFVAAAGRERLAHGPVRDRSHEHGWVVRVAVLEFEQESERARESSHRAGETEIDEEWIDAGLTGVFVIEPVVA